MKTKSEEQKRRDREAARRYREKHAKPKTPRVCMRPEEKRLRAIECARRWQANNPELVKKYKKSFMKRNPDYSKRKSAEFRAKNPDYHAAKSMEWRERNPGYYAEYQRNRAKRDAEFKLVKVMRSRVSMALRKSRTTKRTKLTELIGCEISELRCYLEERFEPGMSWENHGEWHIDHVRPCASFDLSDPAQQRACFHYSNMRPLWARDNLAKGKK